MIRQASIAGLLLALFAGLLPSAHGQSAAVLDKQADTGKGKEPDKVKVQEPQKMSRFASKELARTQSILRILEEEIDTKKLRVRPTIKLRDALDVLADNLKTNGHLLPILIDDEAFKTENPDAPVVADTDCSFQDVVPNRLPAVILLRRALSHVATRNATFLIRRGVVEITTTNRAALHALLQEKVNASFHEVPLGEALLDLAAQNGLALQLDSRASAKLDQPVTATFAHNTSLKAALIVLADQAGLRLVVLGDAAYVTTPENARQLEPLQKEMNRKPPAPKKKKGGALLPGLG